MHTCSLCAEHFKYHLCLHWSCLCQFINLGLFRVWAVTSCPRSDSHRPAPSLYLHFLSHISWSYLCLRFQPTSSWFFSACFSQIMSLLALLISPFFAHHDPIQVALQISLRIGHRIAVKYEHPLNFPGGSSGSLKIFWTLAALFLCCTEFQRGMADSSHICSSKQMTAYMLL